MRKKSSAVRIEVWMANGSSLGIYTEWRTPLALLRFYYQRPLKIQHFYDRHHYCRVVQIQIGKAVAVTKPEEIEMPKERTIVVEGHTLTKTAVEKAYAELQKRETFEPGDIVKTQNLRGTFVIVGDHYLGKILNQQYGVPAKDRYRITNGSRTWTHKGEWLTKVGSLTGSEV